MSAGTVLFVVVFTTDVLCKDASSCGALGTGNCGSISDAGSSTYGDAGSGRLLHLFTVPVWSSILEGLEGAKEEVEHIVSRKHAEFEDPRSTREEVNNMFFGMQEKGDTAWIQVRFN